MAAKGEAGSGDQTLICSSLTDHCYSECFHSSFANLYAQQYSSTLYIFKTAYAAKATCVRILEGETFANAHPSTIISVYYHVFQYEVGQTIATE